MMQSCPMGKKAAGALVRLLGDSAATALFTNALSDAYGKVVPRLRHIQIADSSDTASFADITTRYELEAVSGCRFNSLLLLQVIPRAKLPRAVDTADEAGERRVRRHQHEIPRAWRHDDNVHCG